MEEQEHPIQGLMTTAMENIKSMVEVNTIVGEPVESPDGSMIIPVSKVGFGFAAGGSEFQSQSTQEGDQESILPFGGGSGGGVSITPVAFLIVNDKGIKMVHLNENTHIYEKMLHLAPKAMDKIQELMKESNTKQPTSRKDRHQHLDKSDDNEALNYDI